MRHVALVTRIDKANSKSKKRRRPSKKLVTTLESLAEALPSESPADGQDGLVARQKKLKSKPGAMKRKAKMETVERERFNKNMAQMANPGHTLPEPPERDDGGSDTANTSSAKWAALRNFIQTTLPPK